jgi:hypothetical protein
VTHDADCRPVGGMTVGTAKGDRVRWLLVLLTVLAPVVRPVMAQDSARVRVGSDSLRPSVSADSTHPTRHSTPARHELLGSAYQWSAWVLGTQLNVIGQHLAPLRSPYAGRNSLTAAGDTKVSHAYGIYMGGRILAGLQAYLDIEMIRGQGISHASGLAGITNGDVIRQGTVDLGEDPYIARAFVRYVLPLGHRGRSGGDSAQPAIDQIPAWLPVRRLEVSAGKLALTDLMDLNRYAASTRLQFQNWGLFNNTAWDYAADTRGYTNGVAVAWIAARWAVRVASGEMPTLANGNVFDTHLRSAHGDQAELTLEPTRWGTVVRVLGYINRARMGSYAEALETARVVQRPPDIVADDRPGRTKAGVGLNLEQPVADSGETGVFARLGWSDGKNESFVFTEVDRHASVGVQLAGGYWERAADRLGVGVVRHDLSSLHRAYLAAGGAGFLLGDGRLTYGPEEIVEAYYRVQLGPLIELSPDMQHIWHPGYNRDRGPATVYAFRLNFRY